MSYIWHFVIHCSDVRNVSSCEYHSIGDSQSWYIQSHKQKHMINLRDLVCEWKLRELCAVWASIVSVWPVTAVGSTQQWPILVVISTEIAILPTISHSLYILSLLSQTNAVCYHRHCKKCDDMCKNDRRLMIMHFVKIVHLDVLIATP